MNTTGKTKALNVVAAQWRTKTMRRFFRVRVHVCRVSPMAAGRVRWLEVSSVSIMKLLVQESRREVIVHAAHQTSEQKDSQHEHDVAKRSPRVEDSVR